ncbi:hypothetical protein LEP1GSC137_0182 [Leptospira borgpetersenii str. Noumea 25]|nr:hypothetical protein LEP1GSC137_0182 [Leptospira borgpetersenii str. Noumea 25]
MRQFEEVDAFESKNGRISFYSRILIPYIAFGMVKAALKSKIKSEHKKTSPARNRLKRLNWTRRT